MHVQGSRKGNGKEVKGYATDNGSDDDKQFQNLLKYLGLDQYPGLIPILKKWGSGTTTTMMILMSSDFPWIL
jgi:hypothetical protein